MAKYVFGSTLMKPFTFSFKEPSAVQAKCLDHVHAVPAIVLSAEERLRIELKAAHVTISELREKTIQLQQQIKHSTSVR